MSHAKKSGENGHSKRLNLRHESLTPLTSKTIKAGGHGVPGGENMIRFNDGSVRYLTTFEAKRIQTFPDDFVIKGAWGETMRQIGNAVPVLLAEKIGVKLARQLKTPNPAVHADAAR